MAVPARRRAIAEGWLRSAGTRHCLDVTLRTLAAVGGGYAATYAVTAGLAAVLPLARPDAVLAASLLSFAVYVGFALWSFTAPRLGRLWLGLLAITVAFGAVGFWRSFVRLP